jgi:hypothetical protein
MENTLTQEVTQEPSQEAKAQEPKPELTFKQLQNKYRMAVLSHYKN